MFEGEGRTRTAAQQSFQSWPVGAFGKHRGVDGEAAAALSSAHLVSVTLLDQAAPDEGAQNALLLAPVDY